jgi:aspartate carbamoyltransferase catalytic subunit
MSDKKSLLFRHLISMETVSKEMILTLFDKANFFLQDYINKNATLDSLHGRIVANLFFEPSTRTSNSFAIAAKRLGAIFLNPDMKNSSTVKGEILVDTVHTFEMMGTSIFIIRHASHNTAQFVSAELLTQACVINAGDGTNEHPTQALLDLFTIHQHKPDFSSGVVAIIGDISHSRVAHSLIIGLKTMGCGDIRLIGPETLVSPSLASGAVKVYHSLDEGLKHADVIMPLRIQKERMQKAEIPETAQFFEEFGLTLDRLALANKKAIVMAPGPINRNVEIESSVADGPQSVILQQVRNGVAMRMAVMDALMLPPSEQ